MIITKFRPQCGKLVRYISVVLFLLLTVLSVSTIWRVVRTPMPLISYCAFGTRYHERAARYKSQTEVLEPTKIRAVRHPRSGELYRWENLDPPEAIRTFQPQYEVRMPVALCCCQAKVTHAFRAVTHSEQNNPEMRCEPKLGGLSFLYPLYSPQCECTGLKRFLL